MPFKVSVFGSTSRLRENSFVTRSIAQVSVVCFVVDVKIRDGRKMLEALLQAREPDIIDDPYRLMS